MANSVRLFILACSLFLILILCGLFSLFAPWYSIQTIWRDLNSGGTLSTTEIKQFPLFRPISSYVTVKNNSVIISDINSQVKWSDTNLIELRMLYRLCGTLVIVALVVDFLGILLLSFLQILATERNEYSKYRVINCFRAYHRNWNMFLCSTLGISLVFNTIALLIFIAHPRPYSHDIARIDNRNCTAGPCSSFAGHLHATGDVWGPTFGWIIIVILLFIRVIAAAITFLYYRSFNQDGYLQLE